MHRLLELFVLLILIVTTIHYTAALSLISLVSVISQNSLCALYNQIFYMFDYIIFSKSLMYNSLHALILFILFKTKAYGIDIKKRPKPLKT